jgi:protein-tyrosine phosphatase
MLFSSQKGRARLILLEMITISKLPSPVRYAAAVTQDDPTLHWPGCGNVRDLGGLPTAAGGRTRHGALIRSDCHSHLTAAGVAAVRATAVARILDLRWSRECERHPSPFAADGFYRHVPLLMDVLPYDPPDDSYAPMLDHNGDRIARAFRALATAPPGGAVVAHCHGGRDRTGGLVALALAASGVEPEAIVADYARTPDTDPAAMRNTITHLATRYGGAEPYLLHIGVPRPDIESVRRRLSPGS